MVPVATEQVGCVIVTVAAAGDVGWALITTFTEGAEIHPNELVTVKL